MTLLTELETIEACEKNWKKATWNELENTLKEQKKYSEWLDSWIQAIGKDKIEKIISNKGVIIWDFSQV